MKKYLSEKFIATGNNSRAGRKSGDDFLMEEFIDRRNKREGERDSPECVEISTGRTEKWNLQLLNDVWGDGLGKIAEISP